MTNRSPNLREKYLDGERLFRKYYEMGEDRTVILLTEWAILDGMTSSKGTLPTPMGVWKSMWRWASLKENRDLAWKIYMEHCGKINYAEWKLEMIHIKVPSAWQHNSQVKRDKFLKENGWIDAKS